MSPDRLIFTPSQQRRQRRRQKHASDPTSLRHSTLLDNTTHVTALHADLCETLHPLPHSDMRQLQVVDGLTPLSQLKTTQMTIPEPEDSPSISAPADTIHLTFHLGHTTMTRDLQYLLNTPAAPTFTIRRHRTDARPKSGIHQVCCFLYFGYLDTHDWRTAASPFFHIPTLPTQFFDSVLVLSQHNHLPLTRLPTKSSRTTSINLPRNAAHSLRYKRLGCLRNRRVVPIIILPYTLSRRYCLAINANITPITESTVHRIIPTGALDAVADVLTPFVPVPSAPILVQTSTSLNIHNNPTHMQHTRRMLNPYLIDPQLPQLSCPVNHYCRCEEAAAFCLRPHFYPTFNRDVRTGKHPPPAPRPPPHTMCQVCRQTVQRQNLLGQLLITIPLIPPAVFSLTSQEVNLPCPVLSNTLSDSDNDNDSDFRETFSTHHQPRVRTYRPRKGRSNRPPLPRIHSSSMRSSLSQSIHTECTKNSEADDPTPHSQQSVSPITRLPPPLQPSSGQHATPVGILIPPAGAPISLWLSQQPSFAEWTTRVQQRKSTRTLGSP